MLYLTDVCNEYYVLILSNKFWRIKLFIHKTSIYYFIATDRKVLSMAWTGIALILLPKGMTSHRTFWLPLDLNDIEISTLELEIDKKKLREADVIIWDEASMIPKKALEIVNKTLKDMSSNGKPFGNKLIIIGADSREILPVFKNGTGKKLIEETIKLFELWHGKIENFIILESWKTNDVCSKIYGNVNNNNIEKSGI